MEKINHDLIGKYLSIIKEQDKLLKEAGISNMKLINEKKEISRQKGIYKENAKEWKIKHDTLYDCLTNLKTRCTNIYEVNAINIYKENMGGQS